VELFQFLDHNYFRSKNDDEKANALRQYLRSEQAGTSVIIIIKGCNLRLGCPIVVLFNGEALSLTFNDWLTVEIFGRIKHLG